MTAVAAVETVKSGIYRAAESGGFGTRSGAAGREMSRARLGGRRDAHRRI